jgi:predicted enzyme related to lactoylglutathione lyase
VSVSIGGTTFDCANPTALAEFWAALLGFDVTDVSDDGALVVERAGDRWIWFQKVPEPKVTKNRCHPDLEADDLETAIARAESLGATTIARHREGSWEWNVLQDPEGNEFCLGTRVPSREASRGH